MALVKPVIFQIVGYQNSGKTTFVSQLISKLTEQGIHVASIKHHGHGGKPSVVENKDSSRHLHSGAVASLVEGEGTMLLQADNKFWTLEEKINLLYYFKPDVILIEGFKKECYPKLLFLKEKEDCKLLSSLTNIKAVVAWDKDLLPSLMEEQEIPHFHIYDNNAIAWTIDYLKNKLVEELS